MVSLRLIIFAWSSSRRSSQGDWRCNLDSIFSSGMAKNDSTKTESASMMVELGSGSYQISTAALTMWSEVYASSCWTFFAKNLDRDISSIQWSFDVSSAVNDLLQNRTLRVTFTSIMEGIQHHLSGWFSNGLGCQSTTHFARMYYRLVELGLDFTNHPIKGHSSQVVFLQYMTSSKSGTKMHSEIQCCICLSLLTERVVSANNDKPLAQFVHCINNVWRLRSLGLRRSI